MICLMKIVGRVGFGESVGLRDDVNERIYVFLLVGRRRLRNILIIHEDNYKEKEEKEGHQRGK